MAFAAIVDASAMVALFGRDQADHPHYSQLFAKAAHEHWSLTSTWPCITEASYLLGLPHRFAFLRWVAADGISIFPFDQSNLEGMAELMRRYTESPRTEMDFADASLVYLASDTGVNRIMTLDVRDFSRYRLADGRAFEIL
jgi:predicted nucleic acid-binding protein